MRAVIRNLHKVEFFRETQTDLGVLYSHSETTHGMPIMRTSTPRPVPLAHEWHDTHGAAMSFLAIMDEDRGGLFHVNQIQA